MELVGEVVAGFTKLSMEQVGGILAGGALCVSALALYVVLAVVREHTR